MNKEKQEALIRPQETYLSVLDSYVPMLLEVVNAGTLDLETKEKLAKNIEGRADELKKNSLYSPSNWWYDTSHIVAAAYQPEKLAAEDNRKIEFQNLRAAIKSCWDELEKANRS